jgi:hypothetical protein
MTETLSAKLAKDAVNHVGLGGDGDSRQAPKSKANATPNGRTDDMGWKSKLKIPPKDKRVKTSVSYIFFILKLIIFSYW